MRLKTKYSPRQIGLMDCGLACGFSTENAETFAPSKNRDELQLVALYSKTIFITLKTITFNSHIVFISRLSLSDVKCDLSRCSIVS